MVYHDYRYRLYQHYLSTFFGQAHNPECIAKDYKRYRRYFIRNYARYLPPDKEAKILDLGCGLGHFLHFAKQQGYQHVTGIDISQELVDFCQKQQFDTHVAEITTFLQNTPATFQTIVCTDVIEHHNKDEVLPLLDSIYQALQPGGLGIINTPNINNPFTGPGDRYIAFDHEIGFTESSLRQVLAVANFTSIRIFGHDGYVFYENPLNYLAKLIAFVISKMLYLLSWLYGRNSLKIYDKNLIAVAYNDKDRTRDVA